jgi:2-hydroxychromene-2-carboxylate isomerase
MQLRWYFDVLSPYAWLQWPAVKRWAAQHPVEPVPVVLGALLAAAGLTGPAEHPGKRLQTYRQVWWRARSRGQTLRFPPAHPFDPLPALRLLTALDAHPQRLAAIETVLASCWRDGLAIDTPAALAGIAARFGIDDVTATLADPAVKARLRAATEAAIAAGVFGVPTVALPRGLYWGEDQTGLIDALLADPGLADEPAFLALAAVPVGIERRR